MNKKRYVHAVSVVDAEEVLDFCIDSNSITTATILPTHLVLIVIIPIVVNIIPILSE